MGCDTERIGIPVSGAASAVVSRRFPFPPVAFFSLASTGAEPGHRENFPCDFGEADDRGFVGLGQCCLPFPECPIAVAPAIACFHPFTAFSRVSAFRPDPEHVPLSMSSLLEDMFGCTVSVIIRPSPYDGVEFLNDVSCRGWLMCV